jgi:hypothetical protein
MTRISRTVVVLILTLVIAICAGVPHIAVESLLMLAVLVYALHHYQRGRILRPLFSLAATRSQSVPSSPPLSFSFPRVLRC